MPTKRDSWTGEEQALAAIMHAVTSVLLLEEVLSPEVKARVPSLSQFMAQALTIAREAGWDSEDDGQ